MLWYKSLFEVRSRFLLCLAGALCLCFMGSTIYSRA